MAGTISAGSVVATLKADVSDFQKKIKAAETSLNKAQKAVSKTSMGLRGMAKHAQTVAKAEATLNKKIKAATRATKQQNKAIEEGALKSGLFSTGLAKMATAAIAAKAAIEGVKKAYEFGKASAQFRDTSKFFDAAGKSLEEYRTATKGLISDADLLKKANLAETMGITGDEFLKLANIAEAAAKKTGQSQDFLFDSIVVGTARGSKLILDNLGILVDWGEANEIYAKKMGRSIRQLTDFEKKQAGIQLVLAKGGKMVEEMDKVGADAAVVFTRFGVAMDNFALVLGDAVAPILREILPLLTEMINRFSTLDFNKISRIVGAFSKDVGGNGLMNIVPGVSTLKGLIAVSKEMAKIRSEDGSNKSAIFKDPTANIDKRIIAKQDALNNLLKNSRELTAVFSRGGVAGKGLEGVRALYGEIGAMTIQKIQDLKQELKQLVNLKAEAGSKRFGASKGSTKKETATKAARARAAEEAIKKTSLGILDELDLSLRELNFANVQANLDINDPSGLVSGIAEAAKDFNNGMDELSIKLGGLTMADTQTGVADARGIKEASIGQVAENISQQIGVIKTTKELEGALKKAGEGLNAAQMSAENMAKILDVVSNKLQEKLGQSLDKAAKEKDLEEPKKQADTIGAIAAGVAKEKTAKKATGFGAEPQPEKSSFFDQAFGATANGLTALASGALSVATGGLAALADFFMQLLQQAEGFMSMMRTLTYIVGRAVEPFLVLFDVLDPIMGVLDVIMDSVVDALVMLVDGLLSSGLVDVIIELMRPIMILAPLLGVIVNAFLNIMDALHVMDILKFSFELLSDYVTFLVFYWDGLIKAFVWVIDTIVSIFTFAWQWVVAFFKGTEKPTLDTKAISDQFMDIFTPDPELVKKVNAAKNITKEELDARGKNAKKLGEESNNRDKLNNKLTEGMFNMPTGFKIAAARFGTQTPEQAVSNTTNNNGITIAGNVTIQAGNVQDFIDNIARTRLLTNGTAIEGWSPFGGGN